MRETAQAKEATLIETIFLAVTAFVSTNVDDAILLLGLFASPRFRPRDTIVGQYLGMAVIVGVSIAGAFLAIALPRPILSLIGAAPVCIGLKQLWDAWRSPDGAGLPAAHGTGSMLSVALVTLANGGDNIALFVPLFAGRAPRECLMICAVFAGLLGVWCVGARWLVGHRILGAILVQWGSRLMPFVLIGLGVLILSRVGSR